MTLDEIEHKVASGEMTAAQVFTQMKQHYQLTKWSNGYASVEWSDSDLVLITSTYGGQCKMDGADFELILGALTTIDRVKPR
tara:strand:+ start:4973 stop:5218 length:246 start_codon:yes stop_codon:yes gene_type:complete